MNPQPPEYIGQLCAIGFIFMVIFYTIKAFVEGKAIKIQDKIIVGYIDDPMPTVYCDIEIVKPKTKKVKKQTTTTSTSTTQNPPPPPPDNDEPKPTKPFNPPKQLKQKNDNYENNQLYLDCIDALHALGLKKSDSKKKTKEIFSLQNPPVNIQEFLLLAFRK